MVSDAESHAEEDRRARELAEARNNAENAAYQAETPARRSRRPGRRRLQVADRGGDQGGARGARVRGPRGDQRQGRGAADRVPRRLRGDVPARPGAGCAPATAPRPTAPRRPPTSGRGDAEVVDEPEAYVVDAEVVDEPHVEARSWATPKGRSARSGQRPRRRAARREALASEGAAERSAGATSAEPRTSTPDGDDADELEGDLDELVQDRRSATTTSRSPSARRPTSRTTASASRASAAAAHERGVERAGQGAAAGAGQPRPRARRRGRGRPAARRACGSCARSSSGALARAGIESFCAARRAVRPVAARGRRHRQPVRTAAASGTVVEVYQAGYGWARASSALRAWSWPRRRRPRRWHRDPTTTRRSASTRRRPPRRSRRPTASSRASTTPTATPATSRPRRASRRSPRPTTCSATPRSASSTTAARALRDRRRARRRLRRLRQLRLRRLLDGRHPLQPVRRLGQRPARAHASRAAERGADLEAQVSITFDQAVAGAQVPLPVPMRADLPDLPRHRRQARHRAQGVPELRGRGIETQGQGMFSISQPCSQCGGTGTVIEDPCPTCHGAGARAHRQALRVNIPAGVRDGSRIRLAGKGEPGRNGGPPGDLYLITHVEPSPLFTRKGDNLEVEVPLTIPEALRGAEVQVPTLNGTKTLRVRPGTATAPSSDCAARARRSSAANGTRGDIHYRFVIDVPQDLSKEQRERRRRALQDARRRPARGAVREATAPRRSARARAKAAGAITSRPAMPRVRRPHRGRDRPRRVHDLRRRRARQHAPADAAHVRGARADRAAALAQGHAPVLAGATSRSCGASRR